MESTVNPQLLGPLMIIFAVLWFSGVWWAGMSEDSSSRRPTRRSSSPPPGPWWTNRGFERPSEEPHDGVSQQPGPIDRARKTTQ